MILITSLHLSLHHSVTIDFLKGDHDGLTHNGLDIIMKTSHVVFLEGAGREGGGANIEMILYLGKSDCVNSEVYAPKSHLEVKT